jgi:hypothetical protein
MGGRFWRRLARWVAIAVVTPVVAAGMVAGTAPASSAAPVSPGYARMPAAPASGLAAAPASLRAAVRHLLGFSQQSELAASGAASGDQSGWSVALSAGGTTALVGAPFRNSGAGAVYVFTLRRGVWSQAGELTAADAAPGDEFGWSVALSAEGTTALVGAPFGNTTAGAAYVFTLRRGTWSQAAKLTTAGASDTPTIGPSYIGAKAIRGACTSSPCVDWTSPPQAGDFFGWSVALSAPGSTALVGARGHNSGTGSAYVFTLGWGGWSPAGGLAASDGASDDQFGWSVALSAPGSTALVGARGHETQTGAAYVFTLGWGGWSQAGELTAADGVSGDLFGSSVALSARGATALIGAPDRDTLTGAAYVFSRHRGTWSQAGELTASDAAASDEFGLAVQLSAPGGTALIGAPEHNTTGAAYVFTERRGAWSQAGELTAADAAVFDDFGWAVALSAPGGAALIGAPGHNSASGAAYVFTPGLGA